MDYLTILATRSLILFPSSTPHAPKISPPSSNTTPSTPTIRLPVSLPESQHSTPSYDHPPPSPTPISIPIDSFCHPDPQLYYFLLSHVLSDYPAPSLAPKETKIEAEILVWRELDRGSGFVKALGKWYEHEGRGIGERELSVLASGYRLGLVGEKEAGIERNECIVMMNGEKENNDIIVLA